MDTLSRLLSFLSVTNSEDIVKDCLDKNSFTNLTGGRDRGTEDQASFFRKGITGDWKNHLDMTEASLFSKEAQDEMRYFNYLDT